MRGGYVEVSSHYGLAGAGEVALDNCMCMGE